MSVEGEKPFLPNTFQTPNDIVDKVMANIGGPAFKVLIYITRETLGWKDWLPGMMLRRSLDGLQRKTGLSRQGVIDAIRELTRLKLIVKKKSPRNSRTPNEYALNLDITTGQLVHNFDQSKPLTSPTSQRIRPVLVNNSDSLKLNLKLIKNKNKRKRKSKNGADAPQLDFSPTSIPNKERVPARSGAIPADMQLTVSRVIGRMNELAGTSYRPDSKIVSRGLIPRLREGKSEGDCLAVVENRWSDWCDKPAMLQHFNPETLFRESKFEKYLNTAHLAQRTGEGGRSPGGFAP